MDSKLLTDVDVLLNRAEALDKELADIQEVQSDEELEAALADVTARARKAVSERDSNAYLLIREVGQLEAEIPRRAQIKEAADACRREAQQFLDANA